MGDNWQRVLICTDFHDGPLVGIAEVNGAAHLYERQFDPEQDEYSDQFKLTPLKPHVLAFMLEDWGFWTRWEAAFHQGKVDLVSHPTLPAERARRDEIKASLDAWLEGRRAAVLARRGTFELVEDECASNGMIRR
jgi:hypothetical protein